MKLVIILLCSFLLIGCGKKQVIYKDRIVYVDRPVLIDFPPPPPLTPPILPIDTISPNAGTDEKTRAIASSIILLKSYIKQLEEALRPYEDLAKERKRLKDLENQVD